MIETLISFALEIFIIVPIKAVFILITILILTIITLLLLYGLVKGFFWLIDKL